MIKNRNKKYYILGLERKPFKNDWKQKIPLDSIQLWDIRYDPYGLLKNKNWLINAKKAKKILQLRHIYLDGPLIEVGFNKKANSYKIYVVFNNDWKNPKEEIESENAHTISEKVYKLIDKYAKGD